MSSVPEIVVSYGNGGESTCVDIGVVPSLELRDEQVEEATSNLFSFLRSAFHLPFESRLILHETESGRTLSNETFRDPSFVSNFPRYWYLTAGNGYNASILTSAVFQSLSAEDSTFPSTDYSDLSELLLMERYSPSDLQQEEEFGEEDDEEELGEMYPSLMELSMGQSPSQELGESRDDLMTISLICDKEGDFGAVFRHFTVVANVLCSDNSSSEGGDSRSNSIHSTDSLYTTLNMSSLFVSSVTPGGSADNTGLQSGDIIYSINGQSVTGVITDEIVTIIEDSPKKLILSVSPEKNDDLLFLYPQYVNEQTGEYDRGSNEKILISDIIIRTLNHLSPLTEDGDESPEVETTPHNERRLNPDRTKQRIRPYSADYNRVITTTVESENNFHSLDVTSPIEGGSSEQSLSSGIEYNSSIEDLLIRGSLADIPVEPSPVHSRKFKEHVHVGKKNSLPDVLSRITNGSDVEPGSQNWYTEDGNAQWFPKADDDDQFTVSLPATNGSSSNDVISQSGEFPSAFVDPPSLGTKKSTKLALKLKQTFRNLTGSSSSHPKLEKSSSLGIVKTHSTSAIDRLRVTSTSNLTSRSRSTDLGKIKIKRSSLEALTKVSSEESVVKKRDAMLRKQSSYGDCPNDNVNLPPLNLETQIIPTLDFQNVSPPDGDVYDKGSSLVNNSQSSINQYYLTPELGKNLSGDSISSSAGQRGGSRQGRSYSSQRQRLYQAKNSRTLEDSDKDLFTSSLIVTSSKTTPTNPRRFSHDVTERFSPSLAKKPPARRISSWQNRNSSYRLSNDSYSSQDKIYNFSLEENSATFGPSYQQQQQQQQQQTKIRDRQTYTRSPPHLIRSRSVNEEDPSEEQGLRVDEDRRGFTSSVDPSFNRLQQTRPHSSGGKMSNRKAMYVHPHNKLSTSSLSYDPRGCDEQLARMRSDTKTRKSLSSQPEKFTSVFHGPIHKKQEKDNGGKKPSDRSWRLLYAAIQKHRMVFYGSVQDALANNPLISEPPLDLHQCMVKVMPNGYKNRKNVFRLTCVLDGSECVIQSENQESMMTWMRIIHNLNRMMRIRMGPPQIGMSQPYHRNSTQEDAPKNNVEKRKLYRILTPQPPSKKRSNDHTKDDLSRRQQLLERLKRVKKKKETVEDIDVPCYNTFGKPIEDCPASYENKSIPLIAMVCIKELEKHWMDTEGLYRIAGPIGQVRTLTQELNKGHFTLLQGHHDPHLITAVLKKFLKELPDPLVPIDKYNDFIACAQNGDAQEKRAIMKELVNELPVCHYHTLGFLMRHLTNIAAQHHLTKMNPHNLAIVFGPTVAHKAGDEVVVGEMNASIAIIKILMENLDDYFNKVDFSEFYDDISTGSTTSITNNLNRNPFSRGKSDPTSQNDMYGARSQSPRKSWDGSFMNSLSKNNLTVGSQDAFLLSCDGNSQDLRSRGPHKRRLASSRGKLPYIEEPQKEDLPLSTSSSTSTLPYTPSPITPSSASSTIVSPKRKISYVTAVSKAWDSTTSNEQLLLQSVEEDSASTLKSSSYTKFSFSNRNVTEVERKSSAGPYSASQRTSKQSLNYSDHHHRRWSTIDQNIEIFGPTSSSNSEWLTRSRRSENNLIKGPESCL